MTMQVDEKWPVSKRLLVFSWRLLRIAVGLPMWFVLALRGGCRGFLEGFGREWSDRPRHAQADAAYEEIVRGRYR